MLKLSPYARQHELLFLLLKEVQIDLVLYTYVCCPDFLVFVVVVFECISSNIVKRDMALSSDELRIVFFLVHVKLVLLKFQVAPCYAEISS